MRNQIVALVAAAALIASAAFGVAAVLGHSDGSQAEQALETSGIESNEPGGGRWRSILTERRRSPLPVG